MRTEGHTKRWAGKIMDTYTKKKSIGAWKRAYSIAYLGAIISVLAVIFVKSIDDKVAYGIGGIFGVLLAYGAHKKVSRACLVTLSLMYIANFFVLIDGMEDGLRGSPFVSAIVSVFMIQGTIAAFRLHKAGVDPENENLPNQGMEPTRKTPIESGRD